MGVSSALAPSPPAPSSVCVARQPIFDPQRRVRGYELLFRSGDDNRALVIDAEAATSGVILTAFTEIGLPRLVGARPAWINISRRFLLEGYALPLPAEQVVLEILEDVEPDEEVLRATRRLKDAGYTIALDDFTYDPSFDPLIELADVVKVEALGQTAAELREVAARIGRFPGTRLLAEKVETHAQLTACREMGFELFQGYVLCQPQIVRERTMAPANLDSLRLISDLLDPALEFEELERIIGRDVALSYKLLRYINSALFGFRRTLGSVRDALTMLGIEAIRRWVTLIVLASHEDAPSELVVLGLARAQMCEALAPRASDRGAHFMTGLFSVLDAIMDAPMDDLLGRLPLEPSIADALRDGSGAKGAVLRGVLAFERGDLAVALDALGPGTDPAALQAAYATAIEFASLAAPHMRGGGPEG